MDMQQCCSPRAKHWQSRREKLWRETNVRETRESMEVMHGWRLIGPEREGLEGGLSGVGCFG